MGAVACAKDSVRLAAAGAEQLSGGDTNQSAAPHLVTTSPAQPRAAQYRDADLGQSCPVSLLKVHTKFRGKQSAMLREGINWRLPFAFTLKNVQELEVTSSDFQ